MSKVLHGGWRGEEAEAEEGGNFSLSPAAKSLCAVESGCAVIFWPVLVVCSGLSGSAPRHLASPFPPSAVS